MHKSEVSESKRLSELKGQLDINSLTVEKFDSKLSELKISSQDEMSLKYAQIELKSSELIRNQNSRIEG